MSILISYSLYSVIDDFDHVLSSCDSDLHSGKAQYKSEHQLNDVKKILSNYERFGERYNSFCDAHNRKLKTEKLQRLYPSNRLGFDWEESKRRIKLQSVG